MSIRSWFFVCNKEEKMKGLVQSIMVCLVAIGAFYILSAFSEQSVERDQLGWTAIDGHLLSTGNAIVIPRVGRIARVMTGNPSMGYFSWLFISPYVHYTYAVNDERYEADKSALPCLSLVRAFFITKELSQEKPKADPKEFEKLLTLKLNPATGRPHMPSAEEMFEAMSPKIKVYYNAAKPELSMPDPKVANFFESILWTGIVFAGVGILSLFAMQYHAWIVSGTDSAEQTPAYYEKMTARYKR